MIWLALLKRFWVAIPIAASAIAVLVMSVQLAHAKSDRDQWRQKAEKALQNAAEWQASFRQSEYLRKNEQEGAAQAVNASEASCEARVASARSSAIKIERIVTKGPICETGSSPARQLVDPRSLSDALSGR